MTVAATTNRKTYTGDNVSTSFATSPVIFYLSSNLQVRTTIIATGVSTLLTENTHYTVSGGSTAGAVGTVNLAGGSSPHGALLSTEKLVILRVLPLTQGVDLVNNNNSDAEVLEAALDKLTDIQQQIQEQADRSFRLPSGDESGSDTEVLSVASRAGTVLGFDVLGKLTALVAQTSTSLVSLAASTGATLVGWIQAGTGAVTRLLQDKLRETVSLKDFGAVGNGTVDDTTAILNWLARGGRLYAPAGTYKYTAALTPISNSEIYGDGDSTLFQSGANCKGFSLNGLSNVVLRDFKIDGKRATFTTTSNDAIFVNWVTVAGSNVHIDSVTVVDPAGAGIIALASVGQPSSGLIIDSCSVHETGAHGIIAQDYISDVQITNNKVKNSGLLVADRPCITASRNGSNVVVSNNIVVGSASALGTSVHGISIDTTTNATVQGNVITGCKGYGIESGFITYGSIVGNSINGVTSAGIALSGIESGSFGNTNVSIAGNNITGCAIGLYAFVAGATGVFFHKNISISGNSINASTQRGMDLEFVDRLSIVGNTVYNSTQSGIYILDCKNHFTDGNTVVNNNCAAIHNVVSITLAAGTATVTDTAHGYATSDVITIFGANPADYNGSVVITNTGANTYTYAATAGLTTPAVGTIQATKPPSQAEAGVRIVYSVVTSKPHYALGTNFVYGNGYREYYDVSVNGAVGLFNDVWILKKGTEPRVENLTSAESANVRDRAGLFMKNGKIVIAYNNAGTINYLSCALDGSTVTWVNSATSP